MTKEIKPKTKKAKAIPKKRKPASIPLTKEAHSQKDPLWFVDEDTPPPSKPKKLSVDEVAQKLEELNKDEPQPPVLRRYKSNDATVEKLGEILCQNPYGVLTLRDELVGLLASWEKSGHEGDRAFYLEAWNGYSSFDTDRIGRGSIFIPNLCLSIFGGTQPDKLLSFLNLMSDALANDGTLQRFQLLVYPDHRTWEWRDLIPDKDARDNVYAIFEKLANCDPIEFGASPKDEFNKFPYFNFCPEAQEVFINWSHNLHTQKIPQEDNTLVAQHLGKYDSLFPALALILHLVDCAENNKRGAVSKEAALQAVVWCDYLETHARRCYGLLADGGAHAAQWLGNKIRQRKLKDGFTAHDVHRHGWKYLDKPESVQAALAWLEERQWVRSYPIPSKAYGGRPTSIYRINPKIAFKEAVNV